MCVSVFTTECTSVVALRPTVVVNRTHRRRIYIGDKAKVVTAVRGTEFIQSLAALAILHQNDMKKRMNCTMMI